MKKGQRKVAAADLLKPRTFRLSDAEDAKVKRLGGAAWVRKKINAAKEPT